MPQAGWVPQWQSPELEQVSAFAELQAAQVLAPLPQNATLGALQTLPVQHPPGHVWALQAMAATHTPAVQTDVPPHAAPTPQPQLPLTEQLSATAVVQAEQAAPLAPHEVRFRALTQLEPEQQPLGQLLGLQGLGTQEPAMH